MTYVYPIYTIGVIFTMAYQLMISEFEKQYMPAAIIAALLWPIIVTVLVIAKIWHWVENIKN